MSAGSGAVEQVFVIAEPTLELLFALALVEQLDEQLPVAVADVSQVAEMRVLFSMP